MVNTWVNKKTDTIFLYDFICKNSVSVTFMFLSNPLIAGTEQSGYLNLGIANPIRDVEELARARTDAFFILENDPGLVLDDHRIIARVLDEAPPFAEVVL